MKPAFKDSNLVRLIHEPEGTITHPPDGWNAIRRMGG